MRSSWDRRVIPRWRASSISATLFENLPLKQRKSWKSEARADLLAEVKKKVTDWSNAPTLGVAADLLNYAHLSELRPILKEPAHYIHQHSALSPQILSLAKSVLELDEYPEYGTTPYIYNEISRLKKQLRFNPRDAVAYVDLARHYVVNNQSSAAERPISTALALAKDNRFVLRAASRFYLHLNDPEFSLQILKRSARTLEDPWLLASMIAVETVLGKAPAHFKRAKAMLEGGKFAPLHLAELGAALATLQLNDGHFKNARKLFNVSLNNPNDNAVAQAVWAANEFSMNLAIDPSWLNSGFSSEASYYAFEKAGDYRNATKAARGWFEDEPFSIRPLQAGAFAASILGEFVVAEQLARQALLLDPTCLEVKNNLVFALTAQNRIEEAIALLNDVCAAELKGAEELSGHALANRGMLYYRIGDVERGNKSYLYAVAVLERSKQLSSRDVAFAYWAQEAARASDPQAEEILSRATKLIGPDSMAAKLVLGNAKGAVAQAPEVTQVQFPSIKTWEHDKDKNILIMSKRDPFK